jgi:Cu-Zn family superoxide dismutase
MKSNLFTASTLGVLAAAAVAVPAGQSPGYAAAAAKPVTEAAARLNAQGGRAVGTVLFTQTAKGLRIDISAQNMTPGPHAVHIHSVGKCDSVYAFRDAGAHFDVGKHNHGRLDPKGPHTGDLENQTANKLGFMRVTITTTAFTLGPGPTSLFDADGSSFVIHAGPDDYKSQPDGKGGERVACGVIKAM